MLQFIFLLGGLYFKGVKSGSFERIGAEERQAIGNLLGNTAGQLVNLPGLIPGPPGAPVVNLGGLAPQPNGGPLLNLAPLPLQIPGVANICIDQAGQPLLGPGSPGCSTAPPGTIPGGPTSPGGPTGPGGPLSGPSAGPPGGPGIPGATGPFADLINQLVKLILSLLGPGGAGGPAQPPLLGFPPVPPAQLIPGIPGLPGAGTPGMPQNPFFPFPFPGGIPGGIPGFITISMPGSTGTGTGGTGSPGGGLGPCGKKGTSRILEGSTVSANEYCWHAAIFSRGAYKCSGTIVSPTAVITTAFCVMGNNPSDLSVRVGESVLSSSIGVGGQYCGIQQIYIHPDYNPNSGRYENNIAVIKLSKPIQDSNSVCTICLPTTAGDGGMFDNKKCTVTGFGSTTVPGGRNSDNLKAISVPVVPYSTCARILQKYVQNFQPHQSFLCAGGVAGQDACTGDGGGALACPGSDGVTWSIAGIASWGAGCGKSGIPAVYTNLANVLSFVTGIVNR